jgi:hypothetical protein
MGKQNQIDHAVIDKRRHSNIYDVRSFKGSDCDTDHYLMVAEVRQRLSKSKQGSQNFDIEIFNLRKLNYMELKGQYHVKSSNGFAAFENLDDGDNGDDYDGSGDGGFSHGGSRLL